MPSRNGIKNPEAAAITTKVAQSVEECRAWRGAAIVVDVLRCSTTISSILSTAKNRPLRVYADKEKAAAYRRKHPETDFFSELEYPPGFKKFDNSTYQALTQSDPDRPAIVVTGAGTKAILGLPHASPSLVGCFANINALAAYFRGFRGEVLVVPAGLFYLGDAEDFICARAISELLAGRDTVQDALGEARRSGRLEKFLKLRPLTGERDLEIALDVGRFNVLGRVKLKNDYGEVTDLLA